MAVITEWKGDMEFLTKTESNHEVVLDASPKVGGNDKGVRPKELLIVGLTGCTGMDVVSILRKMKVEDYSFRIEAETENTDSHPVYYKKIHLKYFFNLGDESKKSKVEKAVKLSQERYCGVSEMLKKASELTYEIIYE